MTVEARFPSVCVDCGGPIREGDQILYGEDGWRHARCGLPDDEPRNDLCSHCWTYHAGECA